MSKKQTKEVKFIREPVNVENAIIESEGDIFMSLLEFDKIRKENAEKEGYEFVSIAEIMRLDKEAEEKEKEKEQKDRKKEAENFDSAIKSKLILNAKEADDHCFVDTKIDYRRHQA